MSNKLLGKVAVITGGSAGIGLSTAKRFASEGARVFITGRNQANLDKAIGEIGHGAVAIRADSAVIADFDMLYAAVKAATGKIDVLVLNAGVFAPSPITAVTEAYYSNLFDINVRGTIFAFQKAIPLLVKNASVVLVGSIAAHIGMPGMGLYAATKAAVRALARTWMLELKEQGVRINVLSPGHTWTPGAEAMLSGVPEAAKAGLLATIPMERLGSAEEISNAALFLASDESTYMNGSELTVDGGVSQY